jgi:type II secretory ATPase GspE/PulE/Tfp pilus assembly ATPase PilB-like protein
MIRKKRKVAVKRQPKETDIQIREKLAVRFDALQVMSDATAVGKNRSLIVSGPAGLGKSFTVEAAVKKHGDKINAVSIKGYVRPTGLYKTLY